MSRDQFQELLHDRTGRRRSLRLVSALGCVGLLAFSVYFSREVTGGDQVVATAVAKANAFLETLDGPQRGKALFAFDSAKKPSWSNLPVTVVPRNGLRLGELTQPQRAAALDVLAAVLSKQGYQKAIDIMNGDDQLAQGNNRAQLRHGELLSRLVRHAVGDETVDGAVRRSSPGDQRHDRRQRHDRDADAHRRTT